MENVGGPAQPGSTMVWGSWRRDVAQRGSLQRKESGDENPLWTPLPYPKAGPARTPQPLDQVGWSGGPSLMPRNPGSALP